MTAKNALSILSWDEWKEPRYQGLLDLHVTKNLAESSTRIVRMSRSIEPRSPRDELTKMAYWDKSTPETSKKTDTLRQKNTSATSSSKDAHGLQSGDHPWANQSLTVTVVTGLTWNPLHLLLLF